MISLRAPRTLIFLLAVAGLVMPALGQKGPKLLQKYLEPNKIVKGAIVAMIPPEEIKPYFATVQKASESEENAVWFQEYSAKSTPGVPLPYHEKLGLTKAEYDEYLKLWNQRDFKEVQPVGVRLEKVGEDWIIRVSGAGAKITLLRYNEKADEFRSPNGALKRIEDIKADPASVLRGWTGQEWKFMEEGPLGAEKENFAIGMTEDKKYGLLVYRLQDVSSTGRLLYNQSVLIRFDLPGGAATTSKK